MKKFLTRTFPVVLAGLLVANTSFAASFDREHVITECERIAQQLDYLVKSRHGHEKHCAEEVMDSRRAMKIAAVSVASGDYRGGRSNLMYSERRLQSVYSSCHYFSPMVRPFLIDVLRLLFEMEDAVKTKL